MGENIADRRIVIDDKDLLSLALKQSHLFNEVITRKRFLNIPRDSH